MRKTAQEHRKTLRERLSSSLAIPEDVLMDLPRITLSGNRAIEIENYKNVLEYLENSIQLGCKDYIIKLTGKNMEIVSITDEAISVKGTFLSVSFSQ